MAEIIKKIVKGEFSKRLTVWILSIFGLLVFAMTAILAFINPSLGGSLIGILGVVMPIPTACVLQYFNKAKAENLLKIGKNPENIQEPNNTDTNSQG
jgi:hypothetical protein